MAATLKFLCLLMLASSTSLKAVTADEASPATVVLLHGMGRTRLSMEKLAANLQRDGYAVVNLSYPSTRSTVNESVQHLHQTFQQQRLKEHRTVHFVTHSLGGILVRAFLKQHPQSNLGRVVMLSPPNRGSELADRLMAGPLRHLYRLTTGPAGQELGTSPDSTPNQLGPVDFPLGVITGSRSLNPLFSSTFDGPNDGKVAVERAMVEGMADFLVVRHSHSFIMRSSTVTRETIHFLKHGRFSRSEA